MTANDRERTANIALVLEYALAAAKQGRPLSGARLASLEIAAAGIRNPEVRARAEQLICLAQDADLWLTGRVLASDR